MMTLTTGISQCSILGPILFFIYKNDIGNASSDSDSLQYSGKLLYFIWEDPSIL